MKYGDRVAVWFGEWVPTGEPKEGTVIGTSGSTIQIKFDDGCHGLIHRAYVEPIVAPLPRLPGHWS